MKVGDLVRVKAGRQTTNYKMGVVTHVESCDTTRYCWVRWTEWMENDKWMHMDDLEVIND